MTYRKAVQVWYGSARWKAKRLAQLRAEPLCAYCQREGRIRPANIADHVIPHKGDEGLFWHGKLASLCKQCHDSVKKREEHGKAVVTYGADGWPV
jgi:5-methylcytosine-specific restriction protein A